MGEQFALPEAVEVLRTVHRAGPDGQPTPISACDPLNLAGVLTPGPRVAAVLGNRAVYRDGIPVASLQGGEIQNLADMEDGAGLAVMGLLAGHRRGENGSRGSRRRPATVP